MSRFLIPDMRNAPGGRRYKHAVLGIFRNEAHAIEEWIDHYLHFGFEHFYLIDNASTDASKAVLAPYISSGTVDLFDCKRDGYQIGAYTELLPKITEETEWIGTFDLDEFMYPQAGGHIGAVTERFADQEAILAPWLSFGSAGHIFQPSSIVHGFTRRGPADTSRAFLKAVSRPAAIEYFHQHNPRTRKRLKVLANGVAFGDESFIQLNESEVPDFLLLNNHYRLQSRHYFETVKTQRPEVHESVKDRPKAMTFFEEYDQAWSELHDPRLSLLRQGGIRKVAGGHIDGYGGSAPAYA